VSWKRPCRGSGTSQLRRPGVTKQDRSRVKAGPPPRGHQTGHLETGAQIIGAHLFITIGEKIKIDRATQLYSAGSPRHPCSRPYSSIVLPRPWQKRYSVSSKARRTTSGLKLRLNLPCPGCPTAAPGPLRPLYTAPLSRQRQPGHRPLGSTPPGCPSLRADLSRSPRPMVGTFLTGGEPAISPVVELAAGSRLTAVCILEAMKHGIETSSRLK